LSLHKLAEFILKGRYYHLRLLFILSALVVLIFVFPASVEKCNLLNPNACGLYDCGGNSWSPDETEGNGDSLSLRSGQVDMIGSSKVCLKVPGPGLVKFVWKVDQKAQHVGTLSFWVDNAKAAVCNSQGWTPITYSLREGNDYELAWQFQKIKSIPEGVGIGWIDDLMIEYKWPTQDIQNDSQVTNQRPLNQTSAGPNGQINPILGNILVNPPNVTVNLTMCPQMNITMGWPSTNSGQSEMRYSLCEPCKTNITVINYINNTDFSCRESEIPPRPQEINVSSAIPSGPGWCKEISEALRIINETGTIRIFNGTYYAPIKIEKSVHIVGENNTTTKIIANGSEAVLISHGENVSIENLCLINEDVTSKNAIGVHTKSKGDIVIRNCTILNFSSGISINESNNVTLFGNYITSSGEANCHCIPIALDVMMDRPDKNCTIGIILDMDEFKSWNVSIMGNIIELDKVDSSTLLTLGICYRGNAALLNKNMCSWVKNNTINTNYYKILLFDGMYDHGYKAGQKC